jgi:hypothetical protein
MKTRTFLVPAALGFAICAGLAFGGCKKDEAPPPLPSASVAAAEPAPTLEIAPEEDAGIEDAGPDVKVGGPMRPNQTLARCCAALKQNAASAPAPTNTYMLAAAGICDGAAAAGKDNAAAMGMIRAALRGANLPGGCN